MPRSRVKITVIKRVDPEVIFDGNIPNMPDSDKKYEMRSRRDKSTSLSSMVKLPKDSAVGLGGTFTKTFLS